MKSDHHDCANEETAENSVHDGEKHQYEVEKVLALQAEVRINGKGIDWHLWLCATPTLSAAEAARLMSGLDPDLFENLDSRPTADHRADQATANAKLIQRLAERQGKHSATSEEWLTWASDSLFLAGGDMFAVHIGYRLFVSEFHSSQHNPENATSYSAPADVESGLTKTEKKIREIIRIAKLLEFNILSIPTGGKTQIRTRCKEENPDLFGGGNDPFNGAWRVAISENRVRMKEHAKFSSK